MPCPPGSILIAVADHRLRLYYLESGAAFVPFAGAVTGVSTPADGLATAVGA